jgi:FixJ family two-component response regulator
MQDIANPTTTAAAPTAPAVTPPAAAAAPPPRPAVLYVDDEEQALKYFPKILARGFEVLTANSAAAAITLLEARGPRVGVIVSDQRMPGRTGVELLTEVRRRWPGIVRILLTAYADLDSAIAAVNAGAIHKYLNKPVEIDPMRKTLDEALALFAAQAERETQLKGRLSDLQRVIVADRVTSMAAMADGISHHLRNSMTAMSCFLEELAAADPATRPTTAPPDEYLAELWRLARAERESLLQTIRRVADAARAPEWHPAAQTALEPHVRQAVAAVAAEVAADRITCDLPADLPPLKADGAQLAELIATLIRHVARRCEPGAKLSVRADAGAQLWGVPGVRLRVVGDGRPWERRDTASIFTPFAFPPKDPSDLGVELLLAFHIVCQHGGEVAIHPTAPDGPGFEVLLPCDPALVHRPAVTDAALAPTAEAP